MSYHVRNNKKTFGTQQLLIFSCSDGVLSPAHNTNNTPYSGRLKLNHASGFPSFFSFAQPRLVCSISGLDFFKKLLISPTRNSIKASTLCSWTPVLGSIDKAARKKRLCEDIYADTASQLEK